MVVADLKHMRLGFLPKWMGNDFTQVVYRAIVKSPLGERGVYYIRSDADSALMCAAGNVFSNFNFQYGKSSWVGDPKKTLESVAPEAKEVVFNMDSENDGNIKARYDMKTSSNVMPNKSLFAGVAVTEAQKYFVELYVAFMSWPLHNYWTAVRIDRSKWNLVSVDHSDYFYQFMQNSKVFKDGECTLDSTFYVHDLDYHWHRIEKNPFIGKNETNKTIMFYDGLCPLCTLEVGHYRKLATQHKSNLDFVDVSQNVGSLEQFNVSLDDVMARLHVLDASGRLHTSFRAFLAIWKELPYWKHLSSFVQLMPFGVTVGEMIYTVWAKNRIRRDICKDGTCNRKYHKK